MLLWAFGAVAVVAAAVVSPFASGAATKPYTFTGDVTACAGATSVKFNVVLKNTSKQTLGAADVYAPSNVTVTAAKFAATGAAIPVSSTKYLLPDDRETDADTVSELHSLMHLTDLNLAPAPTSGSVTISVTASLDVPLSGASGVTGTEYWYSLAKQANNFNPGDLDLSNAFTISGLNPKVSIETCVLSFFRQPPARWQKGATLPPSSTVAVRLQTSSGTPVDTSQSLEPPSLSLSPVAPFTFGAATYEASSNSWVYPGAQPNSSSPATLSGEYNLYATFSGLNATSQPFVVADGVCTPGVSCLAFYDADGQGGAAADVTSKLNVTLDFQGGTAKCTPKIDGGTWNQAHLPDGRTFPAVQLTYEWNPDKTMVVLKYAIRNDEWVLTDAARGNNDAEFCFEGVRATPGANNPDPTAITSSAAGPFPVKAGYNEPGTPDTGYAECDSVVGNQCTLFYGVLPTVSNQSRAQASGYPAVCGRGNVDLDDPNDSTSELVTYRQWLICLPYDWDARQVP